MFQLLLITCNQRFLFPFAPSLDLLFTRNRLVNVAESFYVHESDRPTRMRVGRRIDP